MYQSPKELATLHSVSLKTVYNYLNRYPGEIRLKKEDWKTMVHSKDFESLLQTIQSPLQSRQKVNAEDQGMEDKTIEDFDISNVQNDNSEIISENRMLLKRVDWLERQASQYWERFISEKKEKKERQNKYELLQVKLTNQIEEMGKYKLKMLARFFMVSALLVMLLVALWFQLKSRGFL